MVLFSGGANIRLLDVHDSNNFITLMCIIRLFVFDSYTQLQQTEKYESKY